MAIKKRLKQLARIAGWTMLVVCLPWGFWWYWHIPTPGKGGLLLALVATLMPLVWDEIREIGRAGLILTLVILFAVEYRAIDKEHKDYAEDQVKAREAERDSFDKLLDKQERGVKEILAQQERDVKGILDQEQRHFERTLSSLVTAQREERRDFAAILRRQQGLFDQQHEMIESSNGHLLPGDDPMPSMESLGCEHVPFHDGDYLIITGGLTMVVSQFPYAPLRSEGMNIVFSKSEAGLLELSIDIRDRNQLIVVQFSNDGFAVNPGLIKLHPDKSTLIVEDLKGSTVLKARYMNKRTFFLEGKIIVNGEVVDIPSVNFRLSCFSGAAAGVVRQ